MTTTAATRPSEYTTSAPVLHLAFELGQVKWKLGFTPGLGQRPRERTIAARDLGALAQEMARARERFGLPAAVRVVSCYEAGREGFWLHRWLVTQGVESHVVDSASIEVNRRKLRAAGAGDRGQQRLVVRDGVFGWRQFRNRREVGGLAGLTPTPYQSGESSREQGIAKAGNRQGSSRIRRIGIVALARRLLVELWRYLETGVVPEGAALTA